MIESDVRTGEPRLHLAMTAIAPNKLFTTFVVSRKFPNLPIRNPLETFRKGMLHHTPDKRVDRYRCPLHPFTFVRTVVIRDPLAIIAVDPPERDRRTDDICGQIPRSALI